MEGLNVVWNPLFDIVVMDTRVGRHTAKYGIELKEAALTNIRFDPAYEKAIEAKQIEEQKAEQKRHELIQAQRQAEGDVGRRPGPAVGVVPMGARGARLRVDEVDLPDARPVRVADGDGPHDAYSEVGSCGHEARPPFRASDAAEGRR